MAEALILYTILAAFVFTFLAGFAAGFWLGSRDRRTPTPPARRGRHAAPKEATPDE